MSALTDSQWDQYDALIEWLASYPPAVRQQMLQEMEAHRADNPEVLALVASHCALAPHLEQERRGERIGNFTIVEPIAQGGMGVVYRAMQNLLPGVEREVALKMIHPSLLCIEWDEACSRFAHEIQTLMNLDVHAHIAQIYDGGIYRDPHTEVKMPFFAMKLVSHGLSCTDYATSHALSLRERLAMFLKVCDAILHVHHHGIIHRDLKPSNILVDAHGHPYVIDFGLASAFECIMQHEKLALGSGTPAYMSPEQVSDAFGPVQFATDIYALGMILYELLTGKRPYDVPRGTSAAIIGQIITETRPPLLRTHDPTLCGALEAIVATALEKHPTARHPSIAALQETLRNYLQATESSPTYRANTVGPFYLADHRLVAHMIKGPSGKAVLSIETHAPELAAATVRFTIGEETGAVSLSQSPRHTNEWMATHECVQSFTTIVNSPHDFAVELPQPAWRLVTALLVTWAGAPLEASPPSTSAPPQDIRYTQIVTDAVKQYDGYVLPSIMSEEVLALFGVPQAHENDAERAILAALKIRKDLTSSALALSMGITAGRVYVDPRREEVHAVDLRDQVRQVHARAADREILVGAATYRATRHAFVFHPCLQHALSPAYVVLAVVPPETSQRLVGRKAECAALQACLNRLEAGTGSFVAVVGEAGIGKSRLVAEVRKRVGHHIRWLESHALSYTPTMSYGPFGELLRHFADIGPGDDDQEAEAKFSAQLQQGTSEPLTDMLPYLLKLAGVRISDAHAERISYLAPEALGRQLFYAAYRFFACLSAKQPLVLLFENWHRRDRASAELLTHLLPLIHQLPLCICVVSRSEDQLLERCRQLAADPFYHMSLSALSLDESAQLIDILAKTHDMPAQVQRDILHKARGNPFFLEEMIFAYAQSSSTASEEERSIPDTIESQILARVDQLPEHLKNTLRVAAVVGHSFTFAIVQDTLRINAETLKHSLDKLEQLYLIDPYLPAEQTYRFKHDLIQEVIYKHIVLEYRQNLHHQVGDCMEAACTDQLETIVPQLAYHYAQAEAWDKAKIYLLKTGDLARQVASDTAALRLYRQVINLLDNKLEKARWISLQRKIGEAVYWRGKHEEAEALLQGALTHAGSLPPTSRWRMGISLAKHVICHVVRRLLRKPWTRRQSACDAAMVSERLRIYELLVWIAYSTKRLVRFLWCTLMALDLAERHGYVAEASRCFSGIGATLDFGNVLWLAGYYHRRAVVLAEQVQHRPSLGLAYHCLAFHEERLGAWEKALDHYRQAAHIHWENDDLRDWGTTTICLSRIYTQLGNLTLGLEESEKLIHVGAQGGDPMVWGWGELRKGDNLMRLGALDDAAAHLQQACTLLGSVPEYHTLAEANGLLAQCFWRQGHLSQALVVMQEREQLTSQRGLKSHHPRFAEIYLALAECARGTARDKAFKKAKAACQAAQRSQARLLGERPRAYRLRATYAWLRGNPMTARKWWRRSLRSAQRIGARWELGMTHLEMGRRLQKASHLQQAADVFSDLGVPCMPVEPD